MNRIPVTNLGEPRALDRSRHRADPDECPGWLGGRPALAVLGGADHRRHHRPVDLSLPLGRATPAAWTRAAWHH